MQDSMIDEKLDVLSKWWFKVFIPRLQVSSSGNPLEFKFEEDGSGRMHIIELEKFETDSLSFCFASGNDKASAYDDLMCKLRRFYYANNNNGSLMPTIDEMKVDLMVAGLL